MRVPIEGTTPGLRYGHSMVYIMPILILFGGSGKNEILNDVWILSTDKTPFKWEKVTISGLNPTSRVYHTANLYKVAGNAEMMIIYGGRDKENTSLNDLMGIKKDNNGEWEWCEFPKTSSSKDVVPIGRHQQCAAFFGPFLFVVGGRVGGKEQATFDVYSMNKFRWYRFGYVALFRHSIWVYYNIVSQEKYEVYLYIYGGFDGDNNSQINSSLFKINLVELFAREESLKIELSDHISMLLLIQLQKKNRIQQNNKNQLDGSRNQFTLGTRVVAYNINDEGPSYSFANNIRQLSLHKLTEVDKKIVDVKVNKKKYIYDEQLVREFLQLMPLPEHFVPLTHNDKPILYNREYIVSLISQCKEVVQGTPSLLKLKYPIKIFGSLNGQYNDLIRYFNFWGRPHEHKGDIESVEYLFLGNFVNRGMFSLEVLCLLLALKLKYPDQVHILRGSQEEFEICKHYGLAEELKNKFNDDVESNNSIFKQICDLFDCLPLAATINDKILCVHSGLGENTKTLEDIMNVKKPYKIYDTPVAMDILWNIPAGSTSKDEYPGNNLTTNLRKRYFDENLVSEFMKNNKISLIIRSHDVLESGFEKIYDNKIISVFSATNYCGIYNNSGGILFIKKNSEIQPKILTAEDNYSVWSKNEAMYKEYPPSPLRSFKK